MWIEADGEEQEPINSECKDGELKEEEKKEEDEDKDKDGDNDDDGSALRGLLGVSQLTQGRHLRWCSVRRWWASVGANPPH